MRFENRVAIITGAGSGMGLLTSQMLSQEGAIVYMLDINEHSLGEAAAQIEKDGGRAVPCVCDVREYDQIRSAVQKCIDEQGKIDIAVSFAGGFPARMCKWPDAAFTKTPIEVLDWGIDVNFRAPMLLAHEVLEPMMRRKSGVIIHIGSVDGETGGAVDYAAEKSGLTYGLTKAIARVGAPHNVRCCAVSPGPVLTCPEMANMKTALGRAAEPGEVVKLVLYLCSDDAAFITGVNYNIDGGRILLNNQ